MATFVSMATCHTCNKTSRYNGVNRDFTMAFSRTRGGGPGVGSSSSSAGKLKSPPASANRSHSGTPKSAGKEKTPTGKTPAKTPSKMKTPSKTPSKTPRSGSSSTPGSGSSSSTPKSAGSVKKWVVRGLSKMLNRDPKTDSKRGTLKDFLSSL